MMAFKNNTIKKEWHRNYYHREMDKYIQLFGGKCSKCEETKGLQFDHIDRSTKKFSIAKLLSHSKIEIMEELRKCQLFCREHHEEKTILERGFHSRKEHGTLAGYRHGKCRCTECRRVWRDYMRDYYRRKKESRMGVLYGPENREEVNSLV